MDIVKLRTLTKKSKVFFLNVNTEKTVDDILQKDHYKILKAYYISEKINFTEDVLLSLKEHYPNFYVINKPGKDLFFKEKIFDTVDYSSKTCEQLQKMIQAKRINKQLIPTSLFYAFEKSKYDQKNLDDNTELLISKKALMGKNHGH